MVRERWNAELADRISGRAQLISAVRESAAFSFAYIDVVTAKVSADHVAERDRRQRRAAAVQAERARRVAQLTQRPSPSFTRFEDVALVDLLSRDLPAARALVRDELGGLAASGERPALLRAAMLAYLSSYGSHSAAAARLGVHRNTALLRLRRAEELRGRAAGQHSHELLAALLLAETLGDAVLIDG